jgi:hypothetical protein
MKKTTKDFEQMVEQYTWHLVEKAMGAKPHDLFWTGLYGVYAEARGEEWTQKANELVYTGTAVMQA